MIKKISMILLFIFTILFFTLGNLYIFDNYTKEELVIFNLISTFTFLIIYISIFYFYKKYRNKKIKKIYLYMDNILNNDYSLDIREYDEEELSILKNQIYKITTKLKFQTELAQKEKKSLESTLSDISHQIKTPLTSMYVINDLLMEDKISKKQKLELLTKNKNQLERIEWLVTSLLKLSRLESGFVELKKESVSCKNLIDKVIEPLKIPIELKNQGLVLEIENFKINIDINWTTEALINILKNALEHTKENGKLLIKSKDNPMYSSIIIKDNGCGINEKDLPHIFERFYKGKSNKESIGIGLNMAKKIIDLEGGIIEVTSKRNEYTIFEIKFYKNVI